MQELAATQAPRRHQDELLFLPLWRQLYDLGWLTADSTVIANVPDVRRLPDYLRRWLEESLYILQQHGVLRYDGQICSRLDTPELASTTLWQEWEQVKVDWLAIDPSQLAQLTLVTSVLQALPAILRGECLATEVLFPKGSLELVEGIYQGNPISDYFNTLAAEAIVAYVRQRQEQEPQVRLRLIEVGAGSAVSRCQTRNRGAHVTTHIQLTRCA